VNVSTSLWLTVVYLIVQLVIVLADCAPAAPAVISEDEQDQPLCVPPGVIVIVADPVVPVHTNEPAQEPPVWDPVVAQAPVPPESVGVVPVAPVGTAKVFAVPVNRSL
jgi:hypothetical protein